jgi:PAS domain S-box-containing protein
MRLSLDRKYLIALAVSLAATVAIAGLCLQSIGRLREHMAQMAHTGSAQDVLSDVLTALIDIEAGMRGYVLTGDPAFLEPYHSGAQRLGPLLESAERLVEPSADLLDLRAAALAKQDQVATLVALAERQPAQATAQLRAGAGQSSMDRVRMLLARLDATERARLAGRQLAAQTLIARNERLALLLGSACMLLLGGIYLVMRAELRSRQRAQRAEQEIHATLEARVAERTQAVQRASAALALSEARLRMIFDTASDAILAVDEDQTIVMANSAAGSIFGLDVQKLVGSSLDRLIPPRHRTQHRSDVAAFGAAGDGRRVMGRSAEVTGLRADGSEFPAEAAISHATLNDHHLFTVVVRDITRRRLAEKELRDSETRRRRLLDLLPDAVVIDTGGRISYVNAEAQRLFGAPADALIGRAPPELIHPDSQSLARRRTAELLAGRSSQPLAELKILRPDGLERTVESTATTVTDHGETSVVVVLRDVTQLRRIEADLERSHGDLQRLVATQDEVQENERRRIAVELHDDLQQTLAAIKMDLTVAAGQCADCAGAVPLLRRVHELADRAIESTRRIIGDLRPQMLDDLGLVPALQLLASQFEQRTGIGCSLDAEDGALDGRLTHRASTCLFRIVQEALNNAAKHSGADHVEIHLATDATGIALRVADDGVGIPDATQRRSGAVGLVGMHERVRLLGGRLSLRRGEPRGTVVEVAVPLPAAA